MNKLRRTLAYILLLCFALVLFPGMCIKPAFATTPKLNASDVELFLDTIIVQQMEKHNIPNLTVSIVYGGEILVAKGFGYADYEAKIPVDPEQTLFRIGSTSKLFTWTAVMQLVEQGKLDLDKDINQYLDFEIPDRLETRRGQSKLEPITIRHLMSHTPGFEDYMSDVFSISEDSLIPLAQQVRENRPARVFPPGEVTAYSNYGTSLAGYIVELMSGVPFAQYIEENIFTPLGMTNSTFRQPPPRGLADNMSKPYRYVNGVFREAKFEFLSEPAGSMSSSALDMAKFMLAYLQGGQYKEARILEEETVQRMFAERFTQHPRLNGMAHGFIKTTFNGLETFHHPGGTMLYDTGLYLIPDKDLGFFISHSGGNYLVNTEIFQDFLDRYFPAEAIAAPAPTKGMSERSKEFVGEYYQNRRSFTTMDALLGILIGVIQVEADNEGYLLVTHLGETNRFVEVEPGVYFNLREGRSIDYGGDFRTIVFGTDPLGKTMLMSDGPMSYSRAAWYESRGLTFLMIISSMLFIIGSMLYWAVQMIFRREESRELKWAKRVAVLLGMLTLAFLIGLIAGSEVDPVYGFPVSAYTPPSAFTMWLDLILHNAIVFMSVGVVAFTVILWLKSYGQLAGRIHYTIFAMFSAALAWIFYFWNLI